jgi:uncharacterized repeat protein (TIGR03803 family)
MNTNQIRHAGVASAAPGFVVALMLGIGSISSRAQVNTILADPQSETVPTNFTASFQVYHETTPPFSFQWFFDNQPIPNATNSTLNVINAQQTNVGSYVVVISNVVGLVSNATPAVLTLTNVQVQAPSLQFTTLFSFNKFVNGSYPQAKAIQGSDDFLYGTTLTGGTNEEGLGGLGTVFKMSTNGALIWSFSFGGSNGALPTAGLVQAADGNFYGTTSTGGATSNGTVFRITPGGALTNIYSFQNKADGADPQGDLCIGSDGFLYGTTSTNGTGAEGGTVFKMSTNGAASWFFVLTTNTGTVPVAGLAQGTDGNFYGTTALSGTNTAGTVFRISSNEVATAIYSFAADTNGGVPEAGLVEGTDGKLYGSTSTGGNLTLNFGNGYGTLFKITTSGALKTLVTFDGTNGGGPEAGMMLAGDGNFYGTTTMGGAGVEASFGTIFQLTTNGALSTLLSFDGNYNGSSPHSALVQGLDGGLYGTTANGGSNDLATDGDGTVFRLSVLPPAIQSVKRSGQMFSFTWNALVGEMYQPQYKDSLTQSTWMNLGGLVSGTNGLGGQADTITATNLHRYYRIFLQY